MTLNWIAADWPAPDFIKAGVTTRAGGVSAKPFNNLNIATHVGDKLSDVEKNRSILLHDLKIPNAPQWLEQTHSTETILLPNSIKIPKADASYTLEKNIVCAVMTADCLPLLITDEKGGCVAAIHAGWRGLCDGIIEATIKKLPAEAESLLVWMGPAIGADVYEIGKEVYDAYTAIDEDTKEAFTPTTEGHWLFDIYQLAKLKLNKIGIKKIYGGEHCTFSEEDNFFSYRRDNVTGRMASMIWIDK